MSVYVDNAKIPYRGMIMRHMLRDGELDELHAMAERLGLKREWFQNHGTPHYDLCQTKRKLAIDYGAIEIDRRQTVVLIRARRARLNGGFDAGGRAHGVVAGRRAEGHT